MNRESEFLVYDVFGKSESGKTITVAVFNKDRSVHLGMVKWLGAWRKYTFEPYGEMVFDAKCLSDIAQYLTDLTAAHRQGNAAIRRTAQVVEVG